MKINNTLQHTHPNQTKTDLSQTHPTFKKESSKRS